MALDQTGAPLDPYAGMLPDWSDEHERLFQQYIGPQEAAAPAMDPFAQPAPVDPLAAAAPAPTIGTPITPALGEVPLDAIPGLKSDPPLPSAAPEPAPPALAVDAISGGTTAEQEPLQAEAERTGSMAAGPGLPGDDSFSGVPEEYETQEELNLRATTESDPAFAKRQFDLAQRQADFARTEAAKARKADAERAEREYNEFVEDRNRSYEEARKLDAEAKELANTKIDPEKWWNERSTGQKISAFISAIAGGLAAPYNGGRNDGLSMIQGAIDRDVEAQKADLANRRAMLGEARGSLADRLARIDMDHRTTERYRIASLDRVMNQIAADAQQYDQRGSTAVAYGEVMRGLAARRAQAVQAYQQTKLKNDLAIRKQLKDEQEAAQKLALEKQRVNQGWAQIKNARDFHKDEHALADKKLNAEIAKANKEGDTKRADELQKFGISVPGVKTKDGSVFVAQGTPESVEGMRKQLIAARTLVGFIDEARRIRTGYTSSARGREEWKKLKTLWAANKGIAKNLLELGALSGDDYTLMNEFLGSDDPTAASSQAAGMEQARANIITMGRTTVQGHAPDPTNVDFDVPDPGVGARVESDHDRLLKSVLSDQPGSSAEDRAAQARAKKEGTGYITDKARTAIEKWGADARSNDPAIRDQALSALESISQSGSKGAQDLARAKLGNLATPDMPVTESAAAPLEGTRAMEPPIDQYGLPPEGME